MMPPGRNHYGTNSFHKHHNNNIITNINQHNTSNGSLNTITNSINSSGSNSSTPTNTMTRNIGGSTLTPAAPNSIHNNTTQGRVVNGKDRFNHHQQRHHPSRGGGAQPGWANGGNRNKGRGMPWPDSYLAEDENFPSFKTQLAGMGLELRDIPADGNCLFRALGDQLEGHCRNHYRHRADVVNYMRMNRTDFEPFVEDDVSFDDHVRNLQKLGTHAGNDAIVAFAKFNSVDVIIHQLNGKPLLISGPIKSTELTRQLHLAYHNGDHYSSVRRCGDNTESPAHIKLKEPLEEKQKRSQDYKGVVSARRGLEDIETEVAIATNCCDKERVRQSLYECDYDVDAAIADLLQQMEMSSSEPAHDDSTSLTSQQTSTTDSGVWNSLPASTAASSNNSSNSSPTNSSSRHRGGVLRNSSTGSMEGEDGSSTSRSGSVSGKGLKVHFREDSFGGNSSGYGSLSSNNGARPKVTGVPQYQQEVKMSAKKLKEMKKKEKKMKQEEKRKDKLLAMSNNNNNNIYYQQQQYYAADVRDVTVVSLNQGKMARI